LPEVVARTTTRSALVGLERLNKRASKELSGSKMGTNKIVCLGGQVVRMILMAVVVVRVAHQQVVLICNVLRIPTRLL